MRVNKNRIDKFLACSIISEIVLFKGKNAIDHENIEDRWTYDSKMPSASYVKKILNNSNVKWYIKNFYEVDSVPWNGSFLFGLSKAGKIHWSRYGFPSFYWITNEKILQLLKTCPFSGILTEHKNKVFHWKNVPALYLKKNEKSMSFIAGVLCTGKIKKIDGEYYVRYNKNTTNYICSWGIPIERYNKNKTCVFISPFWPAIFFKYMPEIISKTFFLKKACNAERYAVILYRIYCSYKLVSKKMPYLCSRRASYTKYGTIKQTEKDWLNLKLSCLDKNIISLIREYA